MRPKGPEVRSPSLGLPQPYGRAFYLLAGTLDLIRMSQCLFDAYRDIRGDPARRRGMAGVLDRHKAIQSFLNLAANAIREKRRSFSLYGWNIFHRYEYFLLPNLRFRQHEQLITESPIHKHE